MTAGSGRGTGERTNASLSFPEEYQILQEIATVAIELPSGLRESLADLRRQRDDAKREMERVSQLYRDLNELISTIERVTSDEPASTTSRGLLIADGSLRGMSANKAMVRVLTLHPNGARARDLADALYRGGQATDLEKIKQNVGFYMNRWRGAKYLEKGADEHAWKLSELGRAKLSPTAPGQPSELFSNAQQG